MYEHADQSWRFRPPAMTPEIALAAGSRMAEHATEHGLKRIDVVLHGGEPLLLGETGLLALLTALHEGAAGGVHLDLSMQTNGVLLTPAVCELLCEFDVSVGVSLDGDLAANDRHRRFANGASSHDRVVAAIDLLRRPPYRRLYGGLLCTVDVRNDPIAVYEALLAHAPPRIDLLLPHATWEQPPPHRSGGDTPYAAWLRAVHERWRADGRPVPIRLFDSLRALAAGDASRTESLGLGDVDLAVLETDGSWEQVDTLKVAYHGAAATDLTVFADTVDEVSRHPGMQARRGGLAVLSDTCRDCAVVRQCGGGLYPHRYSIANGFDNPSVYCADLKNLITTVDFGVPDAAWAAEIVPEPPATLIDDLAAGRGGAETMAFLTGWQRAIGLDAVDEIRRQAVTDDRLDRVTRAGYAALEQLEDSAPDAVDHALTHPFLRVWATHCLERPAAGSLARSRAWLASLAAAAAVRAGAEMRLTVGVTAGFVHLPALGRLRVDAPGARFAEVEAFVDGFAVRPDGGRETVVRAGSPPDGSWQPVHEVDCAGHTVTVDDVDRWRDCFGTHAVTGRLDPGSTATWHDRLREAWSGIGRQVPEQAGSLRAVLRTVVPLAAEPAGRERSSAARRAFGAVAVAAPASADALAVLLVHEAQHNKLGALLDLCDLADPGRRERLEVSWRADPRPVEGVLQGTYAHLGMADLWRARCAEPGAADAAVREFERNRARVLEGIGTLRDSGCLTGTGERFAAGMEQTVRGWEG